MKELSDFSSDEQIKIKRYKQCMFMYGYFSTLFLLNVLEDSENYEECELILTAIREINSDFNRWSIDGSNKKEIPTKLNEASNLQFREECIEYNVNYDIRILTAPYYAMECLKYVNNIK